MMRKSRRRGIFALIVLALFAAAVASLRNRALDENERQFRERYGST